MRHAGKVVIRNYELFWWITAVIFFCQASAVVWLVLFGVLPLNIRSIFVGIGFLIMALMCIPADRKNADYLVREA